MKYETLHGCSLPKIGFGTWNIGGGSRADPRLDADSLSALGTALELGYTHFDTAESYAAGHCEELLGQAIRLAKVDRERLFITSKVSPSHLAEEQIARSCDATLQRFGCGYLDLYLIHWPAARMNLERTFRALNGLVRAGKVRHLGVSNFDLGLLEESRRFSEVPILTNQVP